jgi:hypothetical protein
MNIAPVSALDEFETYVRALLGPGGSVRMSLDENEYVVASLDDDGEIVFVRQTAPDAPTVKQWLDTDTWATTPTTIEELKARQVEKMRAEADRLWHEAGDWRPVAGPETATHNADGTPKTDPEAGLIANRVPPTAADREALDAHLRENGLTLAAPVSVLDRVQEFETETNADAAAEEIQSYALVAYKLGPTTLYIRGEAGSIFPTEQPGRIEMTRDEMFAYKEQASSGVEVEFVSEEDPDLAWDEVAERRLARQLSGTEETP